MSPQLSDSLPCSLARWHHLTLLFCGFSLTEQIKRQGLLLNFSCTQGIWWRIFRICLRKVPVELHVLWIHRDKAHPAVWLLQSPAMHDAWVQGGSRVLAELYEYSQVC